MDHHLHFQVLGGLRVQRAGRELDLGGARQRRVLAVLLLSLGRPVSAERLTELVWGDEVPGSARVSLQSYVSKLRAVLEPTRRPGTPSAVLPTRTGGYVLDVVPARVDLAAFEQTVAAGLEAHAAGRAADAEGLLAPALAGWAPVLPELAHAPVVVAAARRAESVRATGTEVLARARLDRGRHHAALADLRTATAEDPRAEPLWVLLALALYRSGRQAEALDAVARARRVLREECGLEVGEQLRRLEADLLVQSPALAGPAAPAPTAPAFRLAACRAGDRSRPATARRCAALARPR